MNGLKVTAGMAEAADVGHLEDGIAAALAHPDFRAQVAELMRSMVPDEKRIPMYADRDALRAVGANRFRTETLARIAAWESAR